MKVIDVALKDLLRSTRSTVFWIFGFVMPLMTAGLFYFAFGNASSDGGFQLPQTQVQVVNLDEPSAAWGGFSVGGLLVDILKSDELAELLLVTEAAEADSARAAVDSQEAGVAVIIPAGFTAAALEPDSSAAVEVYQDPTLILGPSIVKGIVQQVVDGFAGSKIAAGVAMDQLGNKGVELDQAALQSLAMQYSNWASDLGAGQQSGDNPLLDLQYIEGEDAETNPAAAMLGLIMAGQLVFYVFFTGAASAQSILQEEEEDTLSRLFTTPTTQASILGGKFLASVVTLVVQVAVLLLLCSAIFDINWGKPLLLVFMTTGLVALSAGFGIFITSFLENTRQAGVVNGGVMTVLGMLGMMRIFTVGMLSTPPALDVVAYFVPQGWGVRGLLILLDGGGFDDILPIVLVMAAAGAVFLALAVLRFRKRFA